MLWGWVTSANFKESQFSFSVLMLLQRLRVTAAIATTIMMMTATTTDVGTMIETGDSMARTNGEVLVVFNYGKTSSRVKGGNYLYNSGPQ